QPHGRRAWRLGADPDRQRRRLRGPFSAAGWSRLRHDRDQGQSRPSHHQGHRPRPRRGACGGAWPTGHLGGGQGAEHGREGAGARHLDPPGAVMSNVRRDILRCIGDTPLLALRRIRPKSGARILLKLESENPTGSMKDRMALAMIEAAEADGRLNSGGSVVEYTGGSTGVSLSLICAIKGYRLHIVTSDAYAREKLEHMRIFGATLQIVRSEGGRT